MDTGDTGHQPAPASIAGPSGAPGSLFRDAKKIRKPEKCFKGGREIFVAWVLSSGVVAGRADVLVAPQANSNAYHLRRLPEDDGFHFDDEPAHVIDGHGFQRGTDQTSINVGMADFSHVRNVVLRHVQSLPVREPVALSALLPGSIVSAPYPSIALSDLRDSTILNTWDERGRVKYGDDYAPTASHRCRGTASP